VNDESLDIAGIERAAFAHALAAFAPVPWPLQDCWPGLPGRAYCFEMIRRKFGWAGFEYARTLPIFTLH
jgi:hypothetical protein